jgi:hypothetical protein
MPSRGDVLMWVKYTCKNIVVLQNFLWMKWFIELLPFGFEEQIFFGQELEGLNLLEAASIEQDKLIKFIYHYNF